MKHWREPLDVDSLDLPKGKIFIRINHCKGCGFCEEYCPKGVLEMSKEFNPKGYHYPEATVQGECVNCRLCEMICPEFAIYCNKVDSEQPENQKSAG